MWSPISQEWLQGKGTNVFKEAFWSWGEWLLPFATKGLGRWGAGGLVLPGQSDSTVAAILKGREERTFCNSKGGSLFGLSISSSGPFADSASRHMAASLIPC